MPARDGKIEITTIWHQHNADGSERAEHCCGCFTLHNARGMAVCNECGEEHRIIDVMRRLVDDADSAARAMREIAEEAVATLESIASKVDACAWLLDDMTGDAPLLRMQAALAKWKGES